MLTISIEIKCDSKEHADSLTKRVMNGSHFVGYKHGAWFWFCECPADEILNLGQELHYELQEAS
jgi:predicted RNase H-related nuclease YkuK (DUF458 family)